MIPGPSGSHPHAPSDTDFENLFTKDKKIVVKYQGYPHGAAGLIFGCKGAEKMHIEGYREAGSTTAPLDVMLRNRVLRYRVAGEAVRGGVLSNEHIALRSVKPGGELHWRIKTSTSSGSPISWFPLVAWNQPGYSYSHSPRVGSLYLPRRTKDSRNTCPTPRSS